MSKKGTPKKHFDFKQLEHFLLTTILPEELAYIVDEILFDYGKMYIFITATCKEEYPLPDDIIHTIEYLKIFSNALKEGISTEDETEK